jgi:hypothetical protein
VPSAESEPNRDRHAAYQDCAILRAAGEGAFNPSNRHQVRETMPRCAASKNRLEIGFDPYRPIYRFVTDLPLSDSCD